MSFKSKIQTKAKPFIKWAGGKTQLISEITSRMPKYTETENFTYIEPFVGSGALLFHLLNNYPNLNKVVINDINKDLIDTYITIRDNVSELILNLKEIELEYHSRNDNHPLKKEYYYNKRALFNERKSTPILQSALFIFLNRTCFNGLYRVNKSNRFNVPMGSYNRPQICNKENLVNVSNALENVIILNSDYTDTEKYAQGNTLYYFDPPYKPISETSSFTSYSKYNFDDLEQIRLRDFCSKLSDNNIEWILSNSDPKNSKLNNDFFDKLYSKYKILRVSAKRNINSVGSSRGKISELLINNN